MVCTKFAPYLLRFAQVHTKFTLDIQKMMPSLHKVCN